MQITTLDQAIRINPNLDAKKLIELPGIELIHLTLKPDEKQKPHSHPHLVVFYVLEGKGSFLYNSTKMEVSPNTSIIIEPEVKRSWQNNTSSDLRILVIKLPN